MPSDGTNQNPGSLNITPTSETEYMLPGFWRRGSAVFIDSCILGILKIFVAIPTQVGVRLAFPDPTKPSHISAVGTVVSVSVSLLTYLIFAYFYYGYFYQKKGATPGKSLMGLKVLDINTGAYLVPWQSFYREVLGKAVSGLTLCIGYLMAVFRKDHRALHDLMCHSRVVQLKKAS